MPSSFLQLFAASYIIFVCVHTIMCCVLIASCTIYLPLWTFLPNPHFCPPPSIRCFNYATTTLSLISSKDVFVTFMSYEGLEPVALSMSQDVIVSFMSYEGLEQVAFSMSQGTPDGFTDLGNVITMHGLNTGTGPQSSEGSNPGLGETRPDLSGAACFSSDDESNNPYNSILGLQAPDLATVPEMVQDKGCWSEAARRFQDHPDFAALLNFMNSLGHEAIEDEDFLDFYTLASFMDILRLRQEETDNEDAPYDVVKVLLNADAVSE